MRTLSRNIAAALAFGGFAAGGAFLVWVFSQVGTWGTFAYSYAKPSFIAFGIGICLGPLLFCLAVRGLRQDRGRRWRVAALILSGLAGLASLVLSFGFLSNLVLPALTPLPNLDKIGPVLLEPAAGIPIKPHATGQAPLRVAFSSDSHVEKENADNDATVKILAMVGSGDYDAFFHLGDITEFGKAPEGWLKARSMLTAGLGSIPLRTLLGNHDTVFGGAEHYKSIFFPQGMKSDSGSPFYYSIKAGPVLFVVVNLLWGVEDFDPAQRAWLEKTLADCPPGVQIVLLSHCYMYASGYVDTDTGLPWYDHAATIPAITPLLEKYHVSLSVAGHNHYMEYLRHVGVGYAIIGAMGGLPDPEPSYISPASVWRQSGTFGYLELAAWPDRLELSFIGLDGRVLHQERIANPRLPATIGSAPLEKAPAVH